MRKGKRVEVYLPDDHPILLIPPGKRSQTIREALDLSVWLKEQLQILTEQLENMNKRLVRVEEVIVSGDVSVKEHEYNNEPPKAAFDIDAFTDL